MFSFCSLLLPLDCGLFHSGGVHVSFGDILNILSTLDPNLLFIIEL